MGLFTQKNSGGRNAHNGAGIRSERFLTVRETAIFAFLGALMYITFSIMLAIPSVHLLALFMAATTLTYRTKALIPIYVYVMIYGILYGFALWWIPYLYIWLPLWGGIMLVSKIKMPVKIAVPVYMVVCGLHGLSFGTLYAPAQALIFGMSFRQTLVWISAGFAFDVIHCISSFAFGILILPLHRLLLKLDGRKL